MVIFIGMFGVAVSYLIGYWGMQLTTATNSALVISAEPIFTALLSIILLRERVERRQMALLLVGVAGAYLIVGNGLPPQKILGDRFAEGNALVALSLLCEAGYTVLAKRVMQRMSALVITIYATWIGTLVLLPAALLTHTNSGIGAAFLPATPAGWAGVLYISAGCTVAAYLLWNLVVQSVPASVAGAFLFIQPVVGAFLGIILLGDRLTWATLLGALVIFASLILVARSSNLVQAEADVLH